MGQKFHSRKYVEVFFIFDYDTISSRTAFGLW